MGGVVEWTPVGRAWDEYQFGSPENARAHLAEFSIPEGAGPAASAWIASLYARLGDLARAEELIDEAAATDSPSTWLHGRALPTARATVALARNDPEKAIEELSRARFERADLSLPMLRGEALAAAGRPRDAIAEYQKVLDWPGVEPIDVARALAHLEMGRAYVAAGDTEGARDAYLRFLEMWAEADEDLALLQKARSEYEALPGVKG
jgi:tetratricopeptide (TPR) repeat protein